ncbi:hypothetical protein Daesc_003219 [Daldinia eschscholtzii]|uniref:Uncharacterized protein n=1 Tax=Daldinia eschscholtzii TaxID=292717 RepID=A0AAX6MSH4_9PEZI
MAFTSSDDLSSMTAGVGVNNRVMKPLDTYAVDDPAAGHFLGYARARKSKEDVNDAAILTRGLERFPLVNVNVDVRTWGPHLRRNVMYDVGGILVSFA